MRVRTTIIISIIFLIGLGVLLYPTISDYINKWDQSKRITDYDDTVSNIKEEDYSEIWNEVKQYNQELLQKENRFKLSETEMAEYNSTLNVMGDGIMGYIEIGKLGVKLSIGHGTGEQVLEEGVGHLEGTSLPGGGESTHVALVGHRGLPSAKLFTDLDQMQEGDIFTVHVLKEMSTYQVDQIKVVEPADTTDLAIEEGKSYVTLITCTPYAVNSHRLLVRGVQIANRENATEDAHIDSEHKKFNIMDYAPIIVAGVFVIVFIFLIYRFAKKRE